MFSSIIFKDLWRLILMICIIISQTGCKDTDFFQTCKSFSEKIAIFFAPFVQLSYSSYL